MNQPAGHVEAKTEKRQNWKYDEKGPQQRDLVLSSKDPRKVAENDRRRELIYLEATGASDFPHSRQYVFVREVINPQKGHIRCAAKLRAGGVSDAKKFDTNAVMDARRL